MFVSVYCDDTDGDGNVETKESLEQRLIDKDFLLIYEYKTCELASDVETCQNSYYYDCDLYRNLVRIFSNVDNRANSMDQTNC